MRPNRVAPGTPASQGPDRIYGSGDLPSLERPNAPTATAASKGLKQEQMEQELLEANAVIQALEQRVKDLDKQMEDLKVQSKAEKETLDQENRKTLNALKGDHGMVRKSLNEEIRTLKITFKADKESMEKAFEDEKKSVYSRAVEDGRAEAEEKTKADIQEYKVQHKKMKEETEKAKAEYPELRKHLTKEISRRESQLNTKLQSFEAELEAKRKHVEAELEEKRNRAEAELEAKRKSAEARREQIYREANDYNVEVKQNAMDVNRKLETWRTELELREEAVSGRRAQRSSYMAYKGIYRAVHDERWLLMHRLSQVRAQVSKEREKLEREQDGQHTDSNEAVSNHLQLIGKLNELENGVTAIDTNLESVNEDLRHLGHESRIMTRETRFKDTAHAAEVMSVTIHNLGIQPLRNVVKFTLKDIKATEEQMKDASGATILAELTLQRDAYLAEKKAVERLIDLAYLEHDITFFKTLKFEPFINKATHLAVFDFRRMVDRAAAAREKSKKTAGNGGYRNLVVDHLRSITDETFRLVKRRALLLEVTGQYEEHEKNMDGMIEERIATLEDEMRAMRKKHAKSRLEVLDAFKHVPATQLSSPKSTRNKRASSRSSRRSSEASKSLKNSDTFSQQDGSNEALVLKQQIVKAREVGDIEAESRLKKQKLSIDQRYGDEVLRNIIRRQEALGPETSSNAMRHLNLEIELGKRKMSQLKIQIAIAKIADDVDTMQSLRSELGQVVTTIRADKQQYKARFCAPQQPEASVNASKHEPSDHELSAPKPSFRTRRQRLRGLNARRNESILARAERIKAELEPSFSSFDDTGSRGQDEQASGGLNDSIESTSKESSADKPNSGGLDMKPTAARQAAYQPAGRRQLHDHVLWADFLSQQQVSEGRPLLAINGSSVEAQEARSYGSDLGASERIPSSSVLHAAAEHESDINTEAARDRISSSLVHHAAAEHESDITTEAARDDNSAKSQTDAASASLSPDATLFPTPYNDNTSTTSTMADHDADFVPTYEISSEDKKNALIASRNSTACFWKYTLYKNARGEAPTRHYCTSYEQTEAQAVKFLGAKVVGFDIEWERYKSKAGEDSAKRCVSLVQLAVEDKVALFHLANFRGGDSVDEMVPPSLRAILEDPNVIKVGVNIGGDATRLRNSFGIEMQGNIELSHLYKLVTLGKSQPEKVNKGLTALAVQVEEVLHLPMAKGAVRTSSWSKRLNVQQIEYAASDAYAGLRLYYELERRRKAMDPMPPRPAFHELQLPIILPNGEEAIPKSRRSKAPVEAPEESLEEPVEDAVSEDAVALQEQDDPSEDSDDIYDEPEDLEAFDELLESQDAMASLPEITYPKLPPLDDESDISSDVDDDSSLPSDPLTKPSAATRAFHSPEAATADAWATAWQSQLPATHVTRVSLANLRAYHLWHHQGFDLQETAALLRKEPLALTTVVSYIAEVLQKEGLDFDDERVREVRARLPASVRSRYAKLYAD